MAQSAHNTAITMERVLMRESGLLDRILEEQQNLREEVKARQWEGLMQTISILSMLSDDFNSTDNERDALEKSVTKEQKAALLPLRNDVRSKLLQSKAKSHALSEYIAITQAFVKQVMDDAADSESANVYNKAGRYTRGTVRSVLVDCRG